MNGKLIIGNKSHNLDGIVVTSATKVIRLEPGAETVEFRVRLSRTHLGRLEALRERLGMQDIGELASVAFTWFEDAVERN